MLSKVYKVTNRASPQRDASEVGDRIRCEPIRDALCKAPLLSVYPNQEPENEMDRESQGGRKDGGYRGAEGPNYTLYDGRVCA